MDNNISQYSSKIYPLEVLDDNPLLILRMARRLSRPELSMLTSEYALSLHSKAPRIQQIPRIQIKHEIMLALEQYNAGEFFKILEKMQALRYVIEPLYQTINIYQNEYHSDTLFIHLCEAVNQCKGKKYTPLLKLAVLFHDIGKTNTRRIINGKVTFHSHEIVGASIAYEWMKQYGFSYDEIQYVVTLVRHHQYRFYEETTSKTYKKWLRDVGRNNWRDLFRLRIADRKGNRANAGKPAIIWEMKFHLRRIKALLRSNLVFQEDLAIKDEDIYALNIKNKKLYKKIYANLLGIAQCHPERNNKEWMTAYIKRNYIKNLEVK